MPIRYLLHYPQKSIECRIITAWNAGMDLKKTVRFCKQKGFADTPRIIAMWRALYRQFGCACVPVTDPSKQSHDERSALHKGITGLGKIARDEIAAHNRSFMR